MCIFCSAQLIVGYALSEWARFDCGLWFTANCPRWSHVFPCIWQFCGDFLVFECSLSSVCYFFLFASENTQPSLQQFAKLSTYDTPCLLMRLDLGKKLDCQKRKAHFPTWTTQKKRRAGALCHWIPTYFPSATHHPGLNQAGCLETQRWLNGWEDEEKHF